MLSGCHLIGKGENTTGTFLGAFITSTLLCFVVIEQYAVAFLRSAFQDPKIYNRFITTGAHARITFVMGPRAITGISQTPEPLPVFPLPVFTGISITGIFPTSVSFLLGFSETPLYI